MKARLTIAAAAVALAVAGGAALLSARTSSPAAQSTPSRTARASAALARTAQPTPDIVVRPVPPGPPVKIGAAQKIVTVNGAAISGRQLLAWRAGDPAEQEMTAEMFASLEARAIDRELTFAEARRQGIELTTAQRGQLEEVRKNAQARGETDVAQLDFEENDARAHMLATKLLEKTGVAPPFASEADIKSYYDAHEADFDELPADPAARAAAWQKIQLAIRESLAIEMQQSYQQQLRAYFDSLRARARVER